MGGQASCKLQKKKEANYLLTNVTIAVLHQLYLFIYSYTYVAKQLATLLLLNTVTALLEYLDLFLQTLSHKSGGPWPLWPPVSTTYAIQVRLDKS